MSFPGRQGGLVNCVSEVLEPRRLLSVDVLTWHNDQGRTGLNSGEVMLTPANVNASTFGKLFSYPVTGQVYAQPLYVSNLTIPGKGVHNVIFVVTQNNDVYALDANSNAGVGSGVLWHVNLGLAAATPNSFFANRYGPYHDINPQVGITSTPVIDRATNTMYLDAFTNDVAGQNVYSHHIHAIDLTTGADKLTPKLVTAAMKGNGVGGDGTTITFAATQQLQRPALSLLNGVLYVTYGGYADTDPYHGWILGFNPATLQLQSVLNTTPNLIATPASATADEGGIWMTGAGLASDGTNMFLLIGNGDFNAALGDYGDSILKVAPDSSTVAQPNINGYGLKVADYFTPYNQLSLSNADADLGSGGGIVLPDQPGAHPHEYVGAGKQGTVYLVDRDNMGGYNSTTDNVIQKVSLGHGVFSSPAYFNFSVYYQGVGDVLKRYTLTNGLLSAAPAVQGALAYSATPSISSNGSANGIVWDTQNDATHQVLHAYNAITLAELYNSNQSGTRDQMGTGVKFITPTIADGRVFVGADGAVNVYGLISPPTTAPAAPSSLSAAAASATSVRLTWVDNSDNEGGFKIERSPDNNSFTQIDIAGVNATSYLDTTASPSTQYYYRIRATNVIGDSAYTSPSASASTPAVTGAVYVYHFDAGSGTLAVDSIGGNNGTLTGSPLPQWVAPGRVGSSALNFSGDGVALQTALESAVKVTTNLAPVLGSTSTLTAWFKTTQVGNNTHYSAPAITGVEQAGGGKDINWGTLNASGRIGIYVGDSGGIYSINPVNDGQWHAIAMTRDAVTGFVQLFIDGVLQGSGTFVAGVETSQFFLIGALSDVDNGGIIRTGDNYFNGSLDEVRIYNQVLGADEISGLSQIPAAPTLTGATAISGTLVHLTWTSPSAFAQNIEVYRKIGTGGTYGLIATLGATATVYDDQNLTPGTQYFYTIKATDVAGSSPASNTLSVTPPLATVVDNLIFYNGSKFDDQNGSSNITDRTAIATDKRALLPGQTATFANYSSYDKGINGVLIDVANFSNLPRYEDFSFTIGNDNAPGGWASAPVPDIINTYPGRGPGGSTQLTLIWEDNQIQNTWLRVALLANSNTNLATDNVFYFGSAIASTGNNPASAAVTTADDLGARANKTGLGSATLTNVYDFNRDGRVDVQDELIARSHHSGLSPLQLIAPPAAAGAAPVVVTGAEELSSAVVAKPKPAPELTPAPRPKPVVQPKPKTPPSVFGAVRIAPPLKPAISVKRKETSDLLGRNMGEK
ncbi:MAG: pyrrolo-quinoline quinone [Phycisphaerales bacterium]|nr:pyrrolo-quinoline quinone [Phycisphaerales bacterium]